MSSFRMPRADCRSLTRTLWRIVAALSLKSVGHDARVVVQTTFIKSWSDEAEAFPKTSEARAIYQPRLRKRFSERSCQAQSSMKSRIRPNCSDKLAAELLYARMPRSPSALLMHSDRCTCSPHCILTSSLLNVFFSSGRHSAITISQAVLTRDSRMLPVLSYLARLSVRLLALT